MLISSQIKSFLTTLNVEKKFGSSYETLESNGEMEVMINFTCVCTISLNIVSVLFQAIYIFSF